jgi:glycosyltransferase involved in cell wall biosynthesis
VTRPAPEGTAGPRARHLLHVSLDGNLPRYGIGLAVVRLCEALRDAGDHVTLACRESAATALRLDGIEVLPLRHRGGILGSRRAYLSQLRPALRKEVDAVHVHAAARLGWWLLPPRARAGVPLVVTCHSEEEILTGSASGRPAPARSRRHLRQVGLVLAGADAVVVASAWAGALARSAVALRVHEIPFGPGEDRPSPRVAHEGFVVAGLHRLVESKGSEVLLEAFVRAFRDDPQARLVLAGDGPLRDALAERARALGVASRVGFPGWVEGEERRRLLATADVVVVPSLSGETFCLAALDAQGAGAALVVADTGALPERARDGAGLVVPAGDADALSAALRRLREDPGLCDRLTEAGYRAARRLTWAACARAHRTLYGSLRP